jgi:type IV pilus assembly protein PilP
LLGAWLAAAGLLVLAAACGEGAPAPAAVAPLTKKAAASADAGVTLAAVITAYSYNPVAKRDPFRSPVDEGAPRGNEGNCNEPLCQFDMDQLLLVAVVTGDANPIAMVEDPSRRGYIVRRGSRMGKQGGKVTQILRESVVVTEYWTAPDGKVNPNPVALKLTPEKAMTADMNMMNGKPYSP